MKIKTLVALVTLVGAVTASADYALTFKTYELDLVADPLGNTPKNLHAVFDVGGTIPLNNTFMGSLWAGDSAGTLALVLGSARAFETGGGFDGFLDGPTLNVTSASVPGAKVFYQIRAWNTSAGSTFAIASTVQGAHVGVSAITPIQAGGSVPFPGLPIQALVNLHPRFTLAVVPEPSVLALGLLGGAALLFRRRK